jgi:hypothetical protein
MAVTASISSLPLTMRTRKQKHKHQLLELGQ